MESVLAIGLRCVAKQVQADGFLRAEGQRVVEPRGEPVKLRGMGVGGRVRQKDYVLPLVNLGDQPVIPRRIEASTGIKRIAEFHTVATTGSES